MTDYYKQINVNLDVRGHTIKDFAVQQYQTAPASPSMGQMYYDSTHDILMYYDGTAWKGVPYMDGTYRIPTDLLNVIDSTGDLSDATDGQIPTALLLKEKLDEVITEDSIVTSWSNPLSDTNVPSEKLAKDTIDSVNDTLDTKIDTIADTLDTKIDTEVGSLSDRVDSLEEDMEQVLETKLDDSQLVTSWQSPVSDGNIPSEKLTKDTLDTKIDKASITQSITTSQTEIPSGFATYMALGNKTDITQAIPVWNAGMIYNMSSTVLSGSKIFISLEDGNVNQDPLDDAEHEHWAEVSGSGGSGGQSGTYVNSKTIQFGDGESREYVLNHNMSTYNFIWSLRETEYPREFVNARLQAIDRSNVKIILTSPPSVNALTLNLVATKTVTPPVVVDDVVITEQALEWEYANDTAQPVLVQTYDTTGNQIYGNVTQISSQGFDPVTVTFENAQAGTMCVVKSSYVYEFTGQKTWVIQHNLSRFVAIQCYNDTEGQITGNTIQSANTIAVTFDSAKSGFAVISVPTQVLTFSNTSSWVINHNLGRIAFIQTFTESGDQMFGDIIQDGNTATVTFDSPKSGFLILI